MYAVRSKAGRIVQRFATRAAAERFVRGRTATSPTSGDLGEVARIRVREPLLQERVQTTVPVRIRMSGIDEEWALVVTRGKVAALRDREVAARSDCVAWFQRSVGAARWTCVGQGARKDVRASGLGRPGSAATWCLKDAPRRVPIKRRAHAHHERTIQRRVRRFARAAAAIYAIAAVGKKKASPKSYAARLHASSYSTQGHTLDPDAKGQRARLRVALRHQLQRARRDDWSCSRRRI